MDELPVFWQRDLAEVHELRRQVAVLEDALRMRNVGVGPLLDLIRRLRNELADRMDGSCECGDDGEHSDSCSAMVALTEADQLVGKATGE